jgi:hypothetical protein
MKLLCKKSIKLSPFDTLIRGEFYQIELHQGTILIRGKGMNAPSWLEVDPEHTRKDTNYLNYFYSESETRDIILNNLINDTITSHHVQRRNRKLGTN